MDLSPKYRHLKDQNTVINWYNGRGVASSILLMKRILCQRGLLAEACRYLKEAYKFNKIYDVTSKAGVSGERFEDSDAVGMELPSLLACVLLMEDSAEKLRDMRHFLYYLENFCLGYAPGIASGCKPDGTIFHHGGYIRQYQVVAVYSIARILYVLSDSVFSVSQESVKRYRKILDTEYMMYHGVFESYCLTQYFFNPMRCVGVHEFANLANALHDEELAGRYLTLASTSSAEMGTLNYQKFTERGISPAPLPDAHQTLSYSAAAIHRRGEYLVTVRGHSQYVYPMEIWPDEAGAGKRYSAFSMFRSFGFLELARYPRRDGGTDNGIWIDRGFDYRRWNGATAVCIPYSRLKSRPLDVGDEWGEWLLSDQPFVGGLDDSQGNGVFALRLHGHPKYGLDGFRANKSYHFYEDMILCVGSGITSDERDYDTETTLFQDFEAGAVREGNLLADNRNNGYYLWDTDNLEFFEKKSQSRDMKDLYDTYGTRVFALLNHKKAPADESYRYLIRLGKGLEGLRQIDIGREVEILRHDKFAHIVRMFHKTDYVLFRRDCEIHGKYIEGVTESCILSVLEEADGSIRLAVCDPDLRFYHGECEDYDLYRRRKEKAIYERFWTYHESIPSTIWVVVNKKIGHLEIVAGNGRIVESVGSKTILEFQCKDGLTNEVHAFF